MYWNHCSFRALIALLFVTGIWGDTTEPSSTHENEVGFAYKNLLELEPKLELLNSTNKKLEELDHLNAQLEDFANIKKSLVEIRTELEDEIAKSTNLRNQLPTSCAAAMGPGNVNGVYRLYVPSSGLKPFNAYCMRDPHNDGGAWTIIQRRQDGSEDFYRNWYDYKHGFGNIQGEFFLGLEKIHALTNAEQQELWVQLGDFEGDTAYARYSKFAIGDEEEKYELKPLGKYSGDAGDAFSGHVGDKFSTRDNDNDDAEDGNCAQQYKTAWWLNSCYTCSLNGIYFLGQKKKNQRGGVDWNYWHAGPKSSLKYAHMAIRPRTSFHRADNKDESPLK